jgi:hypothetical protein
LLSLSPAQIDRLGLSESQILARSLNQQAWEQVATHGAARPARQWLAGAYLLGKDDQGTWREIIPLRAGPAHISDGLSLALTDEAALIGSTEADERGSVTFFRFERDLGDETE